MNAGGHGRETADVLVDGRVVDLARPGATPDRRAAGRPRARLPPLGIWRHRGRHRRHLPGRPAASVGRGRGRGRRRSCAGAASTSPEARTRARCSPTRRATPPGASSTRSGSRACGSAGAVVSPKHANFFQAEPGAHRRRRARAGGRGAPAGARRHRRRAGARAADGRVRRRRPGARGARTRGEHPRPGPPGAAALAPRRRGDRPRRRAAGDGGGSSCSSACSRWLGAARVGRVDVAAARRRPRAGARARRVSPRRRSQDAAGIARGDSMVWIDDGQAVARHRGAALRRASATLCANGPTRCASPCGSAGPWRGSTARPGRRWSTAPAGCSRSSSPTARPAAAARRQARPAVGRHDRRRSTARASPARSPGSPPAGTASVEVTDHGVLLHLVVGPEIRMGPATQVAVKVRAARGGARRLARRRGALRRRQRPDQPGGGLKVRARARRSSVPVWEVGELTTQC